MVPVTGVKCMKSLSLCALRLRTYCMVHVSCVYYLVSVLCTHSVSSVSSVYSGHQSILIPPSELEVNPALWLLAVSQYKVRDTFCSYSVMELCTKGLGLQTDSLKVSIHPPNHHNNDT